MERPCCARSVRSHGLVAARKTGLPKPPSSLLPACPTRAARSRAQPPPAKVPAPPAVQAAKPPPSNYVPTEEWTARLIDRGFTIDEAAAIRGLDLPMIVRHLTWMVRRGHPFSIETVLSPETIAAWDAWRLGHGSEHRSAGAR